MSLDPSFGLNHFIRNLVYHGSTYFQIITRLTRAGRTFSCGFSSAQCWSSTAFRSFSACSAAWRKWAADAVRLLSLVRGRDRDAARRTHLRGPVHAVAGFIVRARWRWPTFKVHIGFVGFWPIMNRGETVVLLCFVCLYFAATGAGACPWTTSVYAGGRSRSCPNRPRRPVRWRRRIDHAPSIARRPIRRRAHVG